MQAMVCEGAGRPLALRTLPRPEPGPGEVQIAVRACGVCRTDLHLVDGELPEPKVPVIPGHEIVGTVTAHGPGVTGPAIGTRVGVPWLGWSCGHCSYCASAAREPLRGGALHRLSARRRLRRIRGRRRALCLPAACRLRRRACGAAAVRRSDRLSCVRDGRRCPHARSLRLRRGGASGRAGRARAGTHGVRLHASRRQRRAGIRAGARRALGGRQRRARRPRRSTPR